MQRKYSQFSVLRARWGAFRAVRALSSAASAKFVPCFDVPPQSPKQKEKSTLEEYLNSRVAGISECWTSDRSFYLDVHDFDLEERTESGRQPIEHLVERAFAYGLSPIPVTGTLNERGPDYVAIVATLIRRGSNGVCIRLDRDELMEAALLSGELVQTLDRLKASPEEADIVMDFRYVGKDRTESIRAATLDSLAVLRGIGEFRNTVLLGSSVPDSLPKKDTGLVRRERRIELDAWMAALQAADGRLIVPGDYGIIGAHYVPPAGTPIPPPRIRYTAEGAHVFLRGAGGDYAALCRQLISLNEYCDRSFSVGDSEYLACAAERLEPSGPSQWVTRDLNHHLEFVISETWEVLTAYGFHDAFNFDQVLPRPLIQQEIIDR